MRYVKPDTDVTLYLTDAPVGLVGTVTVQIENPDGTTHTAATTKGIVEVEPENYAGTVRSPKVAATYLAVWWDGKKRSVEELVVSYTVPDPAAAGGLAPGALITLDEARGFLQKSDGETGQDEELGSLINSASVEIMHHTNREFAPVGDEDEDRSFLYVGGKHLDLSPYDVREVSAITLATDLAEASQVALEPSEWRLRPVPARHGVYQSVRLLTLPDDTRVVLPEGETTFEVTVGGKWGFAAVPDDVKHWCKVTVATWLRKDVAAFSTTLRLEHDRLERPDALPTAVMRGLTKYARTAPLLPR